MIIFGTRPEAIKLAPIVRALGESRHLNPIPVVTGQHRRMLDQVLELFDIAPEYDLNIHRPGQNLSEVLARSLDGLEPILRERRPDVVLVQGDTSTTLAGALAAFYHRLPLVHVEAGLRTGNPESPFPEEMNRRLVRQLASLHLAPTPNNVANLKAEGVSPDRIVCTGNTVIDALWYAIDLRRGYGDESLEDLDNDPRRVVLVTVHRRESWGVAMRGIGRAITRLASDPDLLVVIPLHPNPVVHDGIVPEVRHMPNVRVVEPLPYGSFARLLDRADLVLTDSGGIQEEAPSRGKPVLVLRDTTERPEAVEAGTVTLVGTNEEEILQHARQILDQPTVYQRMARAVNPYGDGRAAARSLQAISWLFKLASRPDDFVPA
jgi:UDP-N-acetylglucosamine 2-epimerase (non-hydrolysing)